MALSRNTIIAIAAAVILVAGGTGAYFWLKSPSDSARSTAAQQDDGPVPDPRVLVISMEAVTQGTKVGKSIVSQMQEFGNKARQDMTAEAKALQTEEAAIAKLPADQRAARLEALAPRRAAFQMKAAQHDAQLKGAFANARAAMAKEIEPVLREIVTKRGANLVMERRAAAVEPDPSLDITAEVVAALDQRMSTYQVVLPPPPDPSQLAPQQ